MYKRVINLQERLVQGVDNMLVAGVFTVGDTAQQTGSYIMKCPKSWNGKNKKVPKPFFFFVYQLFNNVINAQP